MACVSVYLNFKGECEPAFNFYKQIFGNDFLGDPQRFNEMPPSDEMPPIPEEEQSWILHVALPLMEDFILMGSDMPSTMGDLTMGSNVSLSLQLDNREETERLFNALSDGGEDTMPLDDMFWGDYFGSCKDKFGVYWMINCAASAK